MAEAGNTSVSEQEAESCCPGSKEQEADEERAPAHDDGHVCSHCSDDHYTKAASIELVKSSDWIYGDPLTFDQLATAPSEAHHLQDGGSEYRLDRPPPDDPTVAQSGRYIRILHSSFLC